MSQNRTPPETEKVDLKLTTSFWNKELLRENLSLWLFSFAKIRMLFFLRPRMVETSMDRCVVRIPLRWRSKNHLNSMYFAAICAGVDAAGGFLALKVTRAKKARVALIFKDIHGDFLKRAESSVYFVCADGQTIARITDEAVSTGKRVSEVIHVNAYVKTADNLFEQVARFTTTMSLKKI